MKSKFIPDTHYTKILSLLDPLDRELTELLDETGFRLDDLMHLRKWQLCQPELTVMEKKTGKIRTVSISISHNTYWKERSKNSSVLSYAFPALRAGGCKKMHRTTYWRHFSRAVTLAGLSGRGYSPHSMRKRYAVRLFRKRGLKAVQEDLGHTYESTTMLYALSDMLE